MKRVLLSLGILALLAYAGLCVVLFVNQRSMLYFPQPRTDVPGTTVMKLDRDDAIVNVTRLQRNTAAALIYFGGNGEDVSLSAPELAEAYPNRSLFLVHYRGYGGSTGTPSETALVADALALYDVVAAEYKDIVLVGRSLGSGVAVQLASQRPVSRLVLITPYNSIQQLAAQQFPYVPVRWLLQDKFESWKYTERITAPTLLIAAADDEIIPRASAEALFQSFRADVATLRIIGNVGHNNISDSPDYIELLKSTQ
jgi:pimeloyl-ACP methyl ester carboxylesterase